MTQKRTGGKYGNTLSDRKLAGYTGSKTALFNLCINSLTLEQTPEEIKIVPHAKKSKNFRAITLDVQRYICFTVGSQSLVPPLHMLKNKDNLCLKLVRSSDSSSDLTHRSFLPEAKDSRKQTRKRT